ncbi:hypothetical protein L1987_05999 [Smallanthus sonchifolius]|uniref:Uncharacterized protein n=1 Tax=Smallanthus sonchifolius TaxID=185202 RepID=A0ACB9JX33_9ASTR|nr:hypothetical protein L1987_05999 [Smallanthus sonchifolius]
MMRMMLIFMKKIITAAMRYTSTMKTMLGFYFYNRGSHQRSLKLILPRLQVASMTFIFNAFLSGNLNGILHS